jgi:hypothetical protein
VISDLIQEMSGASDRLNLIAAFVEGSHIVRHDATLYGNIALMKNRNLTLPPTTWLDACIDSETRFVLPNRESRIHRRADAAKHVSEEVRASFTGRPLLLTSPGAVNWRTGGLSDPIDLTSSSDPVWVLDCDVGSALITSEIEAPRLRHDFRVTDMGWDVLTVPWFDDVDRLAVACDYANESPLALLSDTPGIGTTIRDVLIAARLTLSEGERDELRELGALVGTALGAGIDAWRPGLTSDFDIAAVISAKLASEGATAVCLIVGGDDRLRAFRHPLAVGEIVNDALMAVVVAKRAGLHAAATRLCVRSADDDIVTLTKSLESIHDTVLQASLPGGTWGDTVVALSRDMAEPGVSIFKEDPSVSNSASSRLLLPKLTHHFGC